MQALQLQPQKADPFVVLRATGELDLHTQDEFEREVARFLGATPVIVDLSGLDFLAISALRSLMVCHRQAATTGHELHYAEPSAQTLRLLSLSGLDAVLPVASTVAQVVGGSPFAVGGFVDQSGRDLAQLDVG